MATIMFAWEMGGGAGHVAPFRHIAQRLRADGHNVVFALRDLWRVHGFLTADGMTCVQAPFAATSHQRIDPPSTYAHILHNSGYADTEQLRGLLTAWRGLFEIVKPDVVVADHAPTALVALRGHSARRVVVGSGFSNPTVVYPLPTLRPWLNQDAERLRADEDRTCATINTALASLGAPGIKQLSELFSDVDESVLRTFPELDHYPQRNGGNYWGPFASFPGEAPLWPGGDGKKIFGYLKEFTHLPSLLFEMRKLGCPALIVSDWHDPQLAAKFAGPALRFTDVLADVHAAASACAFGVQNGNHGTIAELLLAGKPVLMFPLNLDQWIMAKAVEGLGAGVLVDVQKPDEFGPKLAAMLTAGNLYDGAREFARKHAGYDPAFYREKLYRRIVELAQAPARESRGNGAAALPAASKSTAAPAMNTVEATLHQAIAFQQSGRFEAARKLYESVLEVNPNQPDALNLLGVCLLQSGDALGAAQRLVCAVELRPGEASFHCNLGEAWRAQRKFQQAEQECLAALKLKPVFVEAANNLGLALQAQQRLQEAQARFEEALRLAPAFAMAHNNLGNLLKNAGKRDTALEHFRKAIHYAPEFAEAHSNLGLIYLEQGLIEAALAHAREAVRLRPGNAAMQQNLRVILKAENKI
jgi:tetratricopeptide (TPR) repeat protein